MLHPRCHGTRVSAKTEALAIYNLKKYNTSQNYRVVGVDAASSEIGCRPEVFSQAYRYLKHTSFHNAWDDFVPSKNKNVLGFTYHAGEDYLDIVDGLRAIEESVLFLDLGNGDRIGHALAMGEPVESYYHTKRKTLVMPRLEYLDNIVWVLQKSMEYDIYVAPSLKDNLRQKFIDLYQNIYGKADNDNHPDYFTYYQSMLLRGDAPELYRNGDRDVSVSGLDPWSKNGISNKELFVNARRNLQARRLYSLYHFDEQVRKEGSRCDEFIIPDGYAVLVAQLQRGLRNKIKEWHIAIEANPTSNYLIGNHRQYAKHPIISFFNMGLSCDTQELQETPQLNVSLNTDDQGVFSTCLENEYALMAIALEKAKDEEGKPLYNPKMIEDWLEYIRKMGISQRFLKEYD